MTTNQSMSETAREAIVDLENAAIGDFVRFRNGGLVRIGRIEKHEVESSEGRNICYSLFIGGDYSEHIGNFSRCGINEKHPYTDATCEIIALLTPEPLVKVGGSNE